MFIKKLKSLLKKIKNREFKIIIRSLCYRIPSFVRKRLPLPQSYSFLIIGTHGVGMHSLLYFLSLCKSIPPPHKSNKNKLQNVLPMPLHISHPEFCYFGINFEVYWNLFKGDGYGKWGFTQDGYGANKTPYIKANLRKKVPAVCLVRDPISAIVSGINYYILKDIFSNDFEPQKDYLDESLNFELFLNATVMYGKNVTQMEQSISEIIYIETKDLMGEATIETIDRISKLFNIVPPQNKEKLLIKVNDSFSRCFPYYFEVHNQKIMVSTFEGIFDPKDYELTYNKKDTRFYIHKKYISEQFPQRPLYVSTQKPIQTTPEMLLAIEDAIENYLHNVQEIQDFYNKHKLTEQSVFEYLRVRPNTLKYLKNVLIEETQIIEKNAPHIFKNWVYYQEFLRL